MEIDREELRDGARANLITSLTALSLPAAEQVRFTGPGCVPCDLCGELVLHAEAYRGRWEMTAVEDAALAAIEAQVAAAGSEHYECFDNSALTLPSWELLRSRAAEALAVFGWTGYEVPPYEQIAPGVMHRPPAVRRAGN